MKIVSIQTGLPREVGFNGKTVSTGIFKKSVIGPVFVNKLNLEGDRQADLAVHGGPDKALYAYSLDAYPWWRQKRPDDSFEYGAFGENLVIDELREDKTYVGDTFEVGGAVIQVAQPRYPCFKLGIKFNDPGIVKMFTESNRPGVYFRVLQEGLIDAGQEFKLVGREKVLLSVSDLFQLTGDILLDPQKASSYLEIKALTIRWREKFQKWACGTR